MALCVASFVRVITVNAVIIITIVVVVAGFVFVIRGKGKFSQLEMKNSPEDQ